ncbi:SSI family serine proteinase inhibitor [Streptomyces sp. 2224.1]|uniref:SSI family serine proteinase inhibitor n=1 Tax=Streptomyces sp. 2224.1 TaxID=1881020 RepID=UPI003523841B
MAARVVVRPRRVRTAYRLALASLEPVMPHRRTSSLFAAAASAATTAVTRLTATTAAAGRVSATAAVSVVSVSAALVLAVPAASAAPIPLRHHWSGGGIKGVGHRTAAAQHGRTQHGRPVDHGRPVEDDAPLDHRTPAGHDAPLGQRTPAGHEGPEDHRIPAPVRHGALLGHGTTTDHGAPADHGTTAGHDTLLGHSTPTGHNAPLGHDASPGRSTPPGHGAPVSRRTPADHLTVTVHDSGSAAGNGTFELYCHPGGGNHRHIKGACAKLDGMTKWGKDPFAPVPQGVNCTMMYGGPATAHVTGTWAGRPVNADFRRTNGCEISRWGRFEPLLPSTSS